MVEQQITNAECEARAHRMLTLPERDRNVMIALGVLQNRVIDARHRFDQDFMQASDDMLAMFFPPIVTTTVFEGSFGPGDCA